MNTRLRHFIHANVNWDFGPLQSVIATLLQLLGFDHEKLTYRFQGRDYRLTDVHGKLVKGVLA